MDSMKTYHALTIWTYWTIYSFLIISDLSYIDSVDEHSEDILLFFKGGLWKHCRQTGLYDSAPPTNSISYDYTVLWVNAAGYVQ